MAVHTTGVVTAVAEHVRRAGVTWTAGAAVGGDVPYGKAPDTLCPHYEPWQRALGA